MKLSHPVTVLLLASLAFFVNTALLLFVWRESRFYLELPLGLTYHFSHPTSFILNVVLTFDFFVLLKEGFPKRRRRAAASRSKPS